MWRSLQLFLLVQGTSSWQPSLASISPSATLKAAVRPKSRGFGPTRVVSPILLHSYPDENDWGSSYDESDPAEIVQPPTREERLALQQTLMEEKTEKTPPRELRFGPFGSLEVLAIVVALFFAATVFVVGGDTLFVTGTSAAIPPTVNADEILRQDFVRMDTSVAF